MTEQIYPKGIVTFAKNEKQPDFVIGTMIINLNAFFDWAKNDGKQYQTPYKDDKQIKFQITTYEGKPSISVDTFKPKKKEEMLPGNTVEEQAEIEKTFPKNDDLPF